MAVTITRTAWTDDDGSGTTGTVINNAAKTALYDQIDTALALLLPLAGGTLSGDLKFTDATYDIGKSGATRPRDGFFSRNVTIGGTVTITGIHVNDIAVGGAVRGTYDRYVSVRTPQSGNEIAGLELNGNRSGSNGIFGQVSFFNGATETARITAFRIGADGSARLNFLVDSGLTTAMVMDSGGVIYFPAMGTTVSAANAFLDGANSNNLLRVSSLEKYKKDITEISPEEGHRVVMALTGVTYVSKIDVDKRVWPGFIADKVVKATPHLGMYIKDALESVAYDRVPAYLVPAYHQHDTMIADLARRIDALEGARQRRA